MHQLIACLASRNSRRNNSRNWRKLPKPSATAKRSTVAFNTSQRCARHRIPPGAAALQFSMRRPRVAATIIGISKPEHIAQTIAWARHDIPGAVWNELMALPFDMSDPEAARVYRPG